MNYDISEENIRVFKLDNNKITLKRNDPFGFITIHFDKGQLPDNMRGHYTNFDVAKRDVLRYLDKKQRAYNAQESRL